jgi:nucleotide-binding universal stress UspA family protein
MGAFSKILIPVDFSQHSIRAVRYGALFAQRLSANCFLAHVVPSAKALPYSFPMSGPEVEQSQQAAAETELRKLVSDVFSKPSSVEIIVAVGDIHEQLLQIAEDHKADLIIMGTQGRRYLGRWFLGSVTERILRKVRVPIMTVSHSEDGGSTEVPSIIKHVLYATDLSDQSPAAASLAVELYRASAARLTVLNVLEYQDFILWGGSLVQFSEADRTTIVEDTKTRIGNLMREVNAEEGEFETVVAEGKPYQKILQFAQQHDVDLIVLNLQGKSLIERAALGSTAERVVRLAHVPVLSVPISAAS